MLSACTTNKAASGIETLLGRVGAVRPEPCTTNKAASGIETGKLFIEHTVTPACTTNKAASGIETSIISDVKSFISDLHHQQSRERH